MQSPTIDLTDAELDDFDDGTSVHLQTVRMAREIRRRRAAAMIVPHALLSGLNAYRRGIPPGACLLAILQGDLYAAFLRADDDTRASMPTIVLYIREHLASASYGSPEAVSRYLRDAEQSRSGR